MASTDTYRVGDVPVLAVRPSPGESNGRLALWLHFLGGTKEAVRPSLEQLAGRGWTAVSFDAWQHGERATALTGRDLTTHVLGHFRAVMWPVLGHTVLDAVAVVDDALVRYGLAPDVVAGGVSMGGDIAVALAGIDARVSRVSAMVATPDWTRPGMTLLDDASTVLDQGEPTRLGQWYFDALDPMTHLERYLGRPVITFDLAGEDRHVPPNNALAFRDALVALDASAAGRVTVRVHGGLDHMAGGRDPGATAASLDALLSSD